MGNKVQESLSVAGLRSKLARHRAVLAEVEMLLEQTDSGLRSDQENEVYNAVREVLHGKRAVS